MASVQGSLGLKQSSAAFWDALQAHLITMGFKSVLGDPCLFKRVLPDGQVILACTYVDDVTFACSSQDSADWFMRALRERFVIEEGEARPSISCWAWLSTKIW